MSPSFQRQLRAFSAFLLLLACAVSTGVHAQVALTLGDTTLNAGDSGAITARIATDGSAVALQFDVLYDPAILTLGTVNGGPALSPNHSIASNPISPGRDRVVITTAPVTALGAGVLATINLAVLASAAPGTTSLNWSGVVISDASAQAITPASLTSGSVTVPGGVSPPPDPDPDPDPDPAPKAIPALPIWGLGALVALMLGSAGLFGRRSLRALLPVVVAMLALTPESPEAQNLPGDANGDGRIDAEDVRLIVERILERGVLPGDGDCNRDSTINVLDTVCSQIEFVPGATAPIILGPGDRSISADLAFNMNLFAADPDAGATQRWELVSGPGGLAVSSAGVLTWTPAAGDAGPNPVSIRVTDDTARTDEASFSINVTVLPDEGPENAAPRLTVPRDQALLVGTPLAAQASATDPDAGDTLTYSLIDGPAGMTINSGTGALSWTPQGNQTGRADVVIQVADAAGARDFGSFIVEATPLNAGPSAVDDVYIARKGETLVIPAPEGVIQNDTDPNDDALSATRLSDPTLGTVDSFGTDGSFRYTPSEPEGITIGLELKCETDLTDFGTPAGTASAADVDGDGDVELVGFSNTVLGSRIFIVDPIDCSAVVNPIPAESGQPPSQTLATLVNLDDDPELEVVTQYSRFSSSIPNPGPGASDNRLRSVGIRGVHRIVYLYDLEDNDGKNPQGNLHAGVPG